MTSGSVSGCFAWLHGRVQWQDPLVGDLVDQLKPRFVCAQYVKRVRNRWWYVFVISILTVCVSDIKLGAPCVHQSDLGTRITMWHMHTTHIRHASILHSLALFNTIGSVVTQTSSQNKCGGDSVERGSVVLRNFWKKGPEQWYNTVNVADRYVLTST